MPGIRGTRPTIARSDAHASRGLPENTPTTSSDSVTSNSWIVSSGSRRAPVSVAIERMRWRACSSAGRRSGRRCVERLAVTGTGRRHHHDPGAAEVGPPAEVDVVAVEVDRRVEAGDRPEQVGANHQAGRRQGEHVAHRVVLLLVDLAFFDEGVDLAEAVDAEADVLQHARVVPRDELRARRCPAFDRYISSTSSRMALGIEGDVVVQEAEEPVVALDEAQHLVGGGAVAVALPTARTNAFGHTLTDPVGHVAGSPTTRKRLFRLA